MEMKNKVLETGVKGHSCFIVAKHSAKLCLCCRTSWNTALRRDELDYLVEEIPKQQNTHAAVWLLLTHTTRHKRQGVT